MKTATDNSSGQDLLIELLVSRFIAGKLGNTSSKRTASGEESSAEWWSDELRHLAGWGVRGLYVPLQA